METPELVINVDNLLCHRGMPGVVGSDSLDVCLRAVQWVVVQPLEMHQGHDPIVGRIDTIHSQNLDPVSQLGSHGAGKVEWWPGY